jgi:hypothetical protein
MAAWNGHWTRWGRSLILASLSGVIGWFAFIAGEPVPLLDGFDLAIHETGHLLAFLMPELIMFMAGSFAQIAFPAAMAVYFLLKRSDLAGGGFCLAWAGTSAWDVSVYVADAPVQALPLIGGGTHDWAHILGHFDAIDRAGDIAGFIEAVGAMAVLAGIVLALTPLASLVMPEPSERERKPSAAPVMVREPKDWPSDPGDDPWPADQEADRPFR